MLKEKPKESQHMSEFGRTLFSLMLTRGIETRQDLRKRLNDGGYKISQPRLSYYLNGERTVEPMFVASVTELLNLTKEEQRRLAWAYLDGQFEPTQEQAAILAKLRKAH